MGGGGPSFDENENDLAIVPYHSGTLSLHTPLAGADIPSSSRAHPPCPSLPSSPPPHHKKNIKCHLKVNHKHKIKCHLKIKHKHGKKHEHMPPHCQHKHKHSRHVEYPLGYKPHHVHKKKHRHGHINFPLGCESHYVQKKKHRHGPCCSNGLHHICYPIQAVQSKE